MSNIDTKNEILKRNIPFSPPDISELEIAEVAEALRSGWITTGPRTKELERRLAEYCHTSCLLSKLKTLDFTDFCPIFWYNDCKDFDKNKSFFLQFSYRF